jgi:hypothetical protein
MVDPDREISGAQRIALAYDAATKPLVKLDAAAAG